MNYDNKIRIPSKKKLIVYSSLAITMFFSLPRILVLMKLGQTEFDLSNRLLDYGLRTIYSLLFALVFFFINLEPIKVKISFVTIDIGILYQQILLNSFLFIIIDMLLYRFHLLFFNPLIFERAFRFIFNLNLLLEVIFIILISRIYLLLFKNYQIKLDNKLLLKANAEARYEALKNQMDPHFLFNSFNTINTLILNDQHKAVDYVNNMSDVFRYVLESSKKERASLKEEMELIKAYIQMLKGRHGDKLRFSLEVNQCYLPYFLPSMTLQILVENAVKHNVISHNKNLHIDIFTENNTIIVSNNLQEKRTPEPSTGIGLSNLNQRCIYLSGKNLEIKRLNNNFTVIIPLISNEDINC